MSQFGFTVSRLIRQLKGTKSNVFISCVNVVALSKARTFNRTNRESIKKTHKVKIKMSNCGQKRQINWIKQSNKNIGHNCHFMWKKC